MTNTDPYRLVLDRLHAHGKTVQEHGDTATAQCPAHPDRNPSLSISRGDRQPVTLHCHAGCDTGDILRELDLTVADISQPQPEKSQIAARYRYTDQHGTHLYTVERWEPGFNNEKKTFVQRPANGRTGRGAMDGTPRVLYRLPAVTEAVANRQPVWIVEGEKDADRLTREGHTATTNAGGAGRWRPEYNEHLAGARVVIVADRDKPGRDHARHIAATLNGTTAGLLIVEPAAGKDISDHLDAGLGIDQLTPITDDNDEPATDDGLGMWRVDWTTFWDLDHDQSDWLLEPIFARARGHALYADAKAGKSLLLLEACAALATGRPFLHKPAGDPIVVVYCDWEMTLNDLRERLDRFGYTEDDDLTHLHYILLPSIPGLDTPEGGQILTDYCVNVGAELAVIDTTARAVEGEENSADTFRHFYRSTGMPLKQAGVGWVRADHAGKDSERGQRGSSAKNDDVDIVWQAKVTNNDAGGQLVTLTATHKRTNWVNSPVEISRDDTDWPVHTTGAKPAEMVPEGTKAAIDLLDAEFGCGVTVSQRQAERWLRDAHPEVKRDVARAAHKSRQAQIERDGNPSELVRQKSSAHCAGA